MEKTAELVIPQLVQYGALGLLVVFLLAGYIMQRIENSRLIKKVSEIQDKRVDDSKFVNDRVGDALIVIRDKITESCIRVEQIQTMVGKIL